MASTYNHNDIEKKWQKIWEETKLYRTKEGGDKKFYILDMFPYPSGEGLHVGHPKGYIATDVYSRLKKMQGYDVLHPMGFDAFGLPAEQYALKNKVNPNISTAKNVARYKEQLQMLGLDYDWEREINTTDPKFYKWTQWMWKQMYKKGLAYESYDPIVWCPSCKTGLANEDLEDGKCERCGSEVEKKPLRQWTIRITDYAKRLVDDLEKLNWEPHIKELQRNWIGLSEGSEIDFRVQTTDNRLDAKFTVFTTRADTLFGCTYCVLAPEHALVEELLAKGIITNPDEVKKYQEEVKKKTDIDRSAEGKEKTGVKLEGIMAINPANNEEVQVFIADYVLPQYGTGAIMAVPAHDERDGEFAARFNLPVIQVISTTDASVTSDGILCNSGEFSGLSSSEGREKITEKVGGKIVTKTKLRDWVFARQRYWGEPFPIVFDEHHTSYAVADSELPVTLPMVDAYEPTGTGESPLATIKEWVEVYGYINNENEFVSCDKSDERAKLFRRETNTMPQWAGSSWYYLRYIDPKNDVVFADKEKEKKWSPVDFYVGGAEHATRHLIYARFWHKFLYDLGVVACDEPFTKLQTVGLIIAEDGRKMSKRWGNVVNPDEIVREYGADTLRMYEMFMGPFDQAVAWSTKGVQGVKRFLDRFVRLSESVQEEGELSRENDALLHQTIKKVGEDIESFKFNTAISALMILLNALEKETSVSRDVYRTMILLIAPFAPHLAEELWEEGGYNTKNLSIHGENWPPYDTSKLVLDTVIYAIQVNGKLRGEFLAKRDEEEEILKNALKSSEIYQKYTNGVEPKKLIIVKNKIVNIVI